MHEDNPIYPFSSFKEIENFIYSLIPDLEKNREDEEFEYINPLTLPKEQWYSAASVIIPTTFQEYLDSCEEVDQKTNNSIEIALENYYKIEHPWYITLSTLSLKANSEGRLEVVRPLIFDLMKEV
jgi:hypothetical protein